MRSNDLIVCWEVPLQDVHHRVSTCSEDETCNNTSILDNTERQCCRVPSSALIEGKCGEKHAKNNE